MPAWVIHDLRRTARSLLSRAGVRPDISERVLGHVIRGVEGVYDRHGYDDEKADALNRLARLIETIVIRRPAMWSPCTARAANGWATRTARRRPLQRPVQRRPSEPAGTTGLACYGMLAITGWSERGLEQRKPDVRS
jgi:hypothetical protein